MSVLIADYELDARRPCDNDEEYILVIIARLKLVHEGLGVRRCEVVTEANSTE